MKWFSCLNLKCLRTSRRRTPLLSHANDACIPSLPDGELHECRLDIW